MSRFAYAAVDSASQAQQLKFRLLAEVTMTSTTVYACTGINYIYALSNTYSPVGPFGGMDPIQEATDMFPRAIRLWLRAVGSADLVEPMTENLFNKSVKLRRAFLTDSMTLVATPELFFSGRVNGVNVYFGDATKGNYAELEVESRLRIEPRSARYNKESLWQTYSGDTFFNFVEQISGFISQWGKQDVFFAVPGAPPTPTPGKNPGYPRR